MIARHRPRSQREGATKVALSSFGEVITDQHGSARRTSSGNWMSKRAPCVTGPSPRQGAAARWRSLSLGRIAKPDHRGGRVRRPAASLSCGACVARFGALPGSSGNALYPRATFQKVNGRRPVASLAPVLRLPPDTPPLASVCGELSCCRTRG